MTTSKIFHFPDHKSYVVVRPEQRRPFSNSLYGLSWRDFAFAHLVMVNESEDENLLSFTFKKNRYSYPEQNDLVHQIVQQFASAKLVGVNTDEPREPTPWRLEIDDPDDIVLFHLTYADYIK